VRRTIVGFGAYCVLILAELSPSNCKRLCTNKELNLFLDLIQGRRIWQGACRSPVL
jgi:hypothetical protein